MKSLRKKLFLSILAVAFAVVSLATSTFAWFSMNDNVQVSGMKVRTNVSSNLLVSADKTETHFGIQLSQAKNALLEPVSSIDGVNFFYTATNNVDASGDAKSDVYVAYNHANTAAFNTAYGTTGAVGYVDYALFLKATSTVDDSKVALTGLNLTYNGAELGDEKAFRAAIFVNQGVVDAESAEALSTTLGSAISILAPDSAANFTTGKAVDSTSTLNTVLTPGVATVIDDSLDAGHTRYYYVVVRLWLEGEDTTCNTNTFASLTAEWQLDLKFEIGASKTGATLIDSDDSAIYELSIVASTAAGVTLTSDKLSNGATPSAYVWYNAATHAVVAGAETNAAPAASGDYYCIITAADGNIYRTATVTVA